MVRIDGSATPLDVLAGVTGSKTSSRPSESDFCPIFLATPHVALLKKTRSERSLHTAGIGGLIVEDPRIVFTSCIERIIRRISALCARNSESGIRDPDATFPIHALPAGLRPPTILGPQIRAALMAPFWASVSAADYESSAPLSAAFWTGQS